MVESGTAACAQAQHVQSGLYRNAQHAPGDAVVYVQPGVSQWLESRQHGTQVGFLFGPPGSALTHRANTSR